MTGRNANNLKDTQDSTAWRLLWRCMNTVMGSTKKELHYGLNTHWKHYSCCTLTRMLVGFKRAPTSCLLLATAVALKYKCVNATLLPVPEIQIACRWATLQSTLRTAHLWKFALHQVQQQHYYLSGPDYHWIVNIAWKTRPSRSLSAGDGSLWMICLCFNAAGLWISLWRTRVSFSLTVQRRRPDAYKWCPPKLSKELVSSTTQKVHGADFMLRLEKWILSIMIRKSGKWCWSRQRLDGLGTFRPVWSPFWAAWHRWTLVFPLDCLRQPQNRQLALSGLCLFETKDDDGRGILWGLSC